MGYTNPLKKARRKAARSLLQQKCKLLSFVLASFPRKKGEVDPVHDTNLIGFDDHAVNQRAQNLATRRPIRRI